MRLEEGKDRFIESWGKLGSNWGINRTMAQVHALLLVSHKPLSASDIMDKLRISRGNACMNLRSLMDWGLVHKVLRQGERKEFYEAEKDIMLVMKQIIIHRKKKELDPMVKVLDDISCVQSKCEESAEFCRVVNDLKKFSHKADHTLDNLLKSEASWIYQALFRGI
jgi:DNA-binding transcriptional regulator GbsR (MarR family)